MRWYRGLAVIGAALLIGACSDSASQNDCGEGETYDEDSGECIATFGGPGGSDAGDASGSGGGADARSAPDGSSGPSGPQRLPDPSCEDWTDEDGDGELCRHDNCPKTKNPKQKDTDRDGVGDKCDNCPNIANAAQYDSNDDGKGNACSGEASYDRKRDHDGDGVPTVQDNCPRTKNSGQKDTDNDNLGDACDNCKKVANYNQTDSNDDGTGDACTLKPAGKECDRVEEKSTIKRTDVYTILDKSGSMGDSDGGGDTKMEQAKAALKRVANVLGGTSMQFGLFAYDSLGCEEFLPMGQYSSNRIQNEYKPIEPGNRTPTGPAMEEVRTRGLFLPQGSGSSNQAVVVITDGNANQCTCDSFRRCIPSRAKQYAIDEAQAFRQQENTKVYVVGFNFEGDTSALNQMAQAGGTNQFIQANNAKSLAKTLLGVAFASCRIELNDSSKGKIDPNKVWVKLNNKWIDPSKLTYNKSNHSVRIDPSVCSANAGQRTVTVVAGCPAKCDEDAEEICDYKDNNCNGKIDEGCEGNPTEKCDGQDNDGDGTIDEGCPPCQIEGDKCSEDGDCCSGNCTEQGVCGPPCRPTQTVCSADGQCCSGNCSSSNVCTSG